MNILTENAARISRMSGDEIKAMITELSEYLTQAEIESLVIGDGAIGWTTFRCRGSHPLRWRLLGDGAIGWKEEEAR